MLVVKAFISKSPECSMINSSTGDDVVALGKISFPQKSSGTESKLPGQDDGRQMLEVGAHMPTILCCMSTVLRTQNRYNIR